MVMGAGQSRGGSGAPTRAPRSHPRLAAHLRQLLLLILPSYSCSPGNPSLASPRLLHPPPCAAWKGQSSRRGSVRFPPGSVRFAPLAAPGVPAQHRQQRQHRLPFLPSPRTAAARPLPLAEFVAPLAVLALARLGVVAAPWRGKTRSHGGCGVLRACCSIPGSCRGST